MANVPSSHGELFTNSIIFIRELRRMVPPERHSQHRKPQAQVPRPSPSLDALHASISGTTSARGALAHSPPLSRYHALDALSKGQDLPRCLFTHALMPTFRHHTLASYRNRIYGARFVGMHGERFVSTTQGENAVRIYDTAVCEANGAWRQTHALRAEGVRWTITDFDVSPDSRWLAYTTISSLVRIVDLNNRSAPHDVLDLCTPHLALLTIWSVKWSPDGRELIVGGRSSHVMHPGVVIVYDVTTRTVVDAITAHDDDVNSLCYMHSLTNDIILSASDDSLVKLWDRRVLRTLSTESQALRTTSCGVFVGHQYGLTCVSPRDDGRFFISNSKDQMIKLWDARKCTSEDMLDTVQRPPRDLSFDYRKHTTPFVVEPSDDFRDDSVMTFAGAHETLNTLIRCHFSPMHTTGQRYVYCGSSDGLCVVYDVLSGDVVHRLKASTHPVRDVSWHPHRNILTTGSWDGRVVLWATHPAPRGEDEVDVDYSADEDE